MKRGIFNLRSIFPGWQHNYVLSVISSGPGNKQSNSNVIMSLLNRYYHGNRQIYGDVRDDYDEDGDN